MAGGYEDYLRRAAGEGDEERVKKLLKRGVSADPRHTQHTSALELAARNGHIGCVVALMDAGADANRASDSTPVIEAAANGHVDILKLMLQRKADPTQKLDGNSALHMAAHFGHQAAIEVLAAELEMPAAALAANNEGKTPLMLACSLPAGGEAVVQYLLGIRADPAAADAAGNNALHHAALAGNAALVKLLLDSGKAGPVAQAAANSNGRTPLHVAACFGRSDVAQLLLQQKQAGVVATADKDGSTVLHLVVKSLLCNQATQLDMAQAFIRAGANPAALDAAGFAAEHYAAGAVKKLLASPAGAAVAAPPMPEDAVLATSSSGALPQQQATPAGKAEKLRQALAIAMAENEAAGSESWVVKQALRRHTSEEQDGWKLTTAVTDHDHAK
uniref:Uncharacterized protein n=1 Tax=Tetradesmus obliquus TaxID=3088 RepID=A0A383WG28_TETOB|eukprot:jgi/Sobl393_1/1907/SZX76340.1